MSIGVPIHPAYTVVHGWFPLLHVSQRSRSLEKPLKEMSSSESEENKREKNRKETAA